MLIGMLFESLGIGMLMPVLAVMTQGDLSGNYPKLVPLFEALGSPSQEQLVVGGMIALAFIYLLKSLYLAFMTWYQMHFAFGVQASLSRNLLDVYLSQPYTFHLQRNSAQLIRNVVTETNLFAQTGLMALLMLMTELIVLLGVGVLLFLIEPLGATLVVCVLGATGWFMHRVTKYRITRWGEERQEHEGFRIQHVQQGLGGIKDVILRGREQDFLSVYNIHNEGSAHAGRRYTTLQAMPRLMLEVLAVSGLVVLVVVMVMQGKSLDLLLPTLGVFAAAAFRLMPSVNRILISVQNIRYALPVVDVLYSELKAADRFDKAKELHSEKPILDDVLALKEVEFVYPGCEVKSLENINIEILRGKSIGFIGGSGAGKSTLVDVVLGLLRPTKGVVEVDGVDIGNDMRGWQNQIGYVPQTIFLIDDTLRKNIAFGMPEDEIDDDAVTQAIRSAQLEDFVNVLPNGINTTVGERGTRLSGGQIQRIGIARALYHNPQVLVLDEATSALDVSTEKKVMQAVVSLKGKKTILMVAHRLSTVENCDVLYHLKDGSIESVYMDEEVEGFCRNAVIM